MRIIPIPRAYPKLEPGFFSSTISTRRASGFVVPVKWYGNCWLIEDVASKREVISA
jgi:hypothetical protein